jgi:hypothetical protein
MFKNPTSKFQMFKGTDRSEGARGAALAAARLRVTARSISHPPYFEPTRRLRAQRRPAASREPAFLVDTITCFAKVSPETFVAGIFSA